MAGRSGCTKALPWQARDEPVELLAREVQRARILARPGETAGLQAPRAQPHARTVVDQHLEPIGSAVGKHVGVMGLRAQRKAMHHQREQPVDAAAQIAGAQRQPDRIDADHRPSSRSSAASSRVCASGQCSSSSRGA